VSSGRLFLATIHERVSDGRVRVEVVLGRGSETFTGTADGAATPSQRARLVGEATLNAVTAAVGMGPFDLTAVGTADLGPVRVALAQVRDPGWSDYLVGSALLRDGDRATATAKAVLDALNRRLKDI